LAVCVLCGKQTPTDRGFFLEISAKQGIIIIIIIIIIMVI